MRRDRPRDLRAGAAPPRARRLARGEPALTFACGHVFLAATVTDAGPAVLVFTAHEGPIAALLRRRFGLLPAVLAHGGGIFLIAPGLV